MPVQKAEIEWKKFFGWPFSLLCLVATQKITHAAHSLSQLGELHVKAGYVSTPGGVLGISKNQDDRMEPKVKTQKNP